MDGIGSCFGSLGMVLSPSLRGDSNWRIIKAIRDSGGGRRTPSAPYWGFFFLGQPFDPRPINCPANAAVILGIEQDLCDLAAEVRRKRFSREARPCSLQAGVRKQVRDLQAR